jgi:hypothetical protein
LAWLLASLQVKLSKKDPSSSSALLAVEPASAAEGEVGGGVIPFFSTSLIHIEGWSFFDRVWSFSDRFWSLFDQGVVRI